MQNTLQMNLDETGCLNWVYTVCFKGIPLQNTTQMQTYTETPKTRNGCIQSEGWTSPLDRKELRMFTSYFR